MLSLLVVSCFACLGFSLKCAEASCFLEVVFIVFPLVAVTGDTISLFWVSQTYRLTGLVPPFSYPEDHFARFWTPERTMEGRMGAQNQIFSDSVRLRARVF